MADAAYDDQGWACHAIALRPREAAYSLFATEGSSRFDASTLGAAASRLGVALRILPEKRYPGGGEPLADAATVHVIRGDTTWTAEVVTVPVERARELRAHALAVATTVGGAGMDSLVSRAKRVWQIEDSGGPGPLAMATIFSAARLAAILPPEGAVVGPKSATARLRWPD